MSPFRCSLHFHDVPQKLPHEMNLRQESPSSIILFVVSSLVFLSIHAHGAEIAGKVASENQRAINNTTPHQIYDTLHVEPPSNCQSSRLKRWAWRWHGRILPLLHWSDKARPPDKYVNLRVLWNKAIASLDPKSLAYEDDVGFLTYHMLPKVSRFLLLKFIPIRWYPRWMHANIELRTVYLGQVLKKELEYVTSNYPDAHIRLVILGGGYDSRSLRVAASANHFCARVESIIELDLPEVIQSKAILLERIYRELPHMAQHATKIQLEGVDLNSAEQVEQFLQKVVSSKSKDANTIYTILVSEAVLMYLDKGAPRTVWELSRKILTPHASFLFVDRLNEISTVVDGTSGNDWISRVGWNLIEWNSKPGATRHMGVARIKA